MNREIKYNVLRQVVTDISDNDFYISFDNEVDSIGFEYWFYKEGFVLFQKWMDENISSYEE